MLETAKHTGTPVRPGPQRDAASAADPAGRGQLPRGKVRSGQRRGRGQPSPGCPPGPDASVGCLPREPPGKQPAPSQQPRGAWGTPVFYKFLIFLKQGLIPWPFFVVLWPQIFTKNHCVYMK